MMPFDISIFQLSPLADIGFQRHFRQAISLLADTPLIFDIDYCHIFDIDTPIFRRCR
jgi:hypothetical protein